MDGHALWPDSTGTHSGDMDGRALWPDRCKRYGRFFLWRFRNFEIFEIGHLYGHSSDMADLVKTLWPLKTIWLALWPAGHTVVAL